MCLAPAPLVGSATGRQAALPVLAVGGAAFGAFTASVFTQVLALVHGPAADADTAFRHAMLYQVAAFTITALISLGLHHRPGTGPMHGHSTQESASESKATRPQRRAARCTQSDGQVRPSRTFCTMGAANSCFGSP
ncbi:hypothetical protein [uncultured Streptomyces sp.]|uniref:hypothetical protein n=1 Tax=uncultured Streptomyces sp. TaxID=174707 RepID=UPI002622E23F|nr:hypothetical protein [uncultured Streptomyces sp.]